MSEITVRRQAVAERRQALREIAKERAKKEGKDLSQPSLEEDKGQQQETVEGMPFEHISPEKLVLERSRDDDSALNWTQFAPWGRKEEKKAPSLNTATIWLMARREIAEIWREAKGIQKRNLKADLLEREAAAYWERQEEERMRAEQGRAEFEQQKGKVNEVLEIIGRKLLEEKEKDNLSAEKAVALIGDAFGATGKVYDVQWREDGCDIWIEPWEERWSRRKRELPTIYRIRINDELEMVSYDLVEDEEVLTDRFKESVDEEPSEACEDDEDTQTQLVKIIEQVGRLVEMEKVTESTWFAIVEPWEQMRIRNIERKGEGPVVTEGIHAKVVEGTIVTSAIKGKESWEDKEESESEWGAAPQKEGEEKCQLIP